MAKFLYVLGGLTIVFFVILGFFSGGLGGGVAALVGGVIASAIYFALAVLLDNQQELKNEVKMLREELHKRDAHSLVGNRSCSHCGKEYTGTSCPHCGQRD